MAIKTSGDGNCLVHAVALALWGQHDRTLVSPENTCIPGILACMEYLGRQGELVCHLGDVFVLVIDVGCCHCFPAQSVRQATRNKPRCGCATNDAVSWSRRCWMRTVRPPRQFSSPYTLLRKYAFRKPFQLPRSQRKIYYLCSLEKRTAAAVPIQHPARSQNSCDEVRVF